MSKRTKEHLPCLVCGKETHSDSGVCAVCRDKGHLCQSCGAFNYPVPALLCDECRRITAWSNSFTREFNSERKRLNQPWIEKYTRRAELGLPLFEEDECKGN